MKFFFFLGSIFLVLVSLFSLFFIKANDGKILESTLQDNITKIVKSVHPTLAPAPPFYEIPGKLHVFQTFNNCGPATLSMALSYFGVDKSQAELGQILRPYQVPGGNNDDKSVTLLEVADLGETYGLHSYLRPNGDVEKLKQFISHDIPVVTRTWTKPNEDIGHYRIVRGYDDLNGQIIQDDSLQNKNLRFSYDEFNKMWLPFNYEYLVMVPEEKIEIAERILGIEINEVVAWENAKMRIERELESDSTNWHLLFALSRIYYYLEDFEKSVEYFDKVEKLISFRTLWYQIEPIYSIFELGDHNRVFSITDKILNNQNRAFSELYVLRGEIYEKQGQIDLTRSEYEKAVFYNSGFRNKIPLF